MGCYRLKGFIESRVCPRGAYIVNVLEEIQNHVKYSGRPAIIVIDVFPTLFMLDCEEEVFVGGRHLVLQERAATFYQKLIDAGAELVFFIDGPIKEAKFQRITDVVNSCYESAQEVFEAIRTSTELEPSCRIMTLYYTSYQLIIKNFGKTQVSLKNECDADIAMFANKMNAFAVLSNDTDFLIFPGDWRIWLTDEFNFETFETVEWNKANLRKKLRLSEKYMPIFATMCGTDYMPKDCVAHVQSGLGKGFFHLQLADLVRRLCRNGTPISERGRKSLLDMIHKNQQTSFSKSEIEKFFDDSINLYCCLNSEPSSVKEAWLEQHVLETQSTIVSIIINKVPIPLPQYLIDAQQPNLKQFCELALPLFQRQMGVVLRDKDCSHKHEVLYKPNHTELFDKRSVNLIKPTIPIPPIDEILLSEEVKIEMKLDVLSEILLPGNSKFRRRITLLDMKEATFVPILKICYLKENNQISTDEADVLLLSLFESIRMDRVARHNIIPPKIFDAKAFWIGMVFNQINTVFLNCLIVSGLYEYIQPEIYDGFIFHKMYSKFFERSREERQTLIEPIKQMRIYAN